MAKKLKQNFLLVIFSTALGLVLAELIFRLLLFSSFDFMKPLQKPGNYSNHLKHSPEDFYNDDYFKLNYLFNHSYELYHPDSLLGWWSYFSANSRIHLEEDSVKDKRPLLLYGDSFARCIDSTLCFEDYLHRDTGFYAKHYLLNYGAGGYGLDQIYLLFRETAHRYTKPFVIFSFLTTDLDRSLLSVRDAPKPHFKLVDEKLELENVPILQNSETFFDENPPEINSYLWNYFKSSGFIEFEQDSLELQNHIEEIKALNKAILLAAFQELKTFGEDYLLLIFQPEFHEDESWRMKFIRELCLEHQVPFLSYTDLRNADLIDKKYQIERYMIMGDGHPNSYANHLVSKALKNYILSPAYRDSIQALNNSWAQHAVIKNTGYFKRLIYQSEDWLAAVEKKALEKGIGLDSMVFLDASYMAGQVKAN